VIDWERLKILSGAVAAVVIPVVVAYVGNEYSTALKERELQGRFVELAVDILREEPDKEHSELRKWAASVIDTYSGVKLTDDARSELVESRALPMPRSATAGPWVVVMGADKTLESAQDELNRARQAGYPAARILLREGWYRTVVPFAEKSDAVQALDVISRLRNGSYVRQLDQWCSRLIPSEEGEFENCDP